MQQAADNNSGSPVVIVPGNYDGVHRGHQVLIARAREIAQGLQGRTQVLFFYPHPAALLSPERAPEPLTTAARRRSLLLAHGVDEVKVVEFTAEYAAQLPEEFLDNLLQAGAKGMVVGHDFRFGKRASGTPALLTAWAKTRGVVAEVVAPVVDGGLRISSSQVRKALAEGRVEDAAGLMARVHDVSGTVVVGDQRGRLLGFPTANLDSDVVLHPADGVYAVVVRRLDQSGPTQLLPAVANLGTRPTFAAGRSVEVHLLDFQGSLYGERLRVGFVKRIRGEQRFADVDALREQIGRDCVAARNALSAVEQGTLAWI